MKRFLKWMRVVKSRNKREFCYFVTTNAFSTFSLSKALADICCIGDEFERHSSMRTTTTFIDSIVSLFFLPRIELEIVFLPFAASERCTTSEDEVRFAIS